MNNNLITSLEALREAVEEAMAPTFDKPVYKRHSYDDLLFNVELNPTEKIILMYLSKQTHEVRGSQIMEHIGLKGKGFRNNIEKLLEKGLVRRGTKSFTWLLNNPKKGVL